MLPANNIVMIATKNKGKVKEFAQMFGRLNMEVRSLADYPDLPEVVEDGETFAENAEKKAKQIAERLHLPVLADDSGLSVDKLNGAPGVFSARYAGEKASDEMNNAKMLAELNALDNQGESPFLSAARFICAIALHDPARNTTLHVEGFCNGFIVGEPRGDNGFGYDPLFYLPQFDKTMAELSLEQKNEISHRGQAMRKLFDLIAQ
jgi:XTP/dITP diphosphohydrolase